MSHDPGFDMLIKALDNFRDDFQGFRDDVKSDFALVRQDIRTYVPRGEYEENKTAVDRRLKAIERLVYGVASSVFVAVVLAVLRIKGEV